MKCGGCGAEVDDTSAFPGTTLTCGVCGAKSVAGATPDAKAAAVYRSAPARGAETRDETTGRCPRCGVALTASDPASNARSSKRSEGAKCTRCSGAFVDHAALRGMLNDADADRSSAPFRRRQRFDPDVRTFQCPVCREPMERNPFGATSGIYLDACERHGIWFDARELDDALEYVRAVGLEEARAPLPEPRPVVTTDPRELTPPPRAAPTPGATVSQDAVKMRAGLEAALAYEMIQSQKDADYLARVARRDGTNLLGFVFRMLR